MKRWSLAAALVLAIAGPAAAQTAKVEAVQYPAWLERGGYSVPLAPGITLEARDRLRTGANARVLVRMGEGSTVKLGENARFEIQRIDNRGIFRAALQVLAGAFRFTTGALAKRQHRDVTIKVTNITAGIRGTDVWGKSTDERDLVCLLEGKVSVRADGGPDVTLDKPFDFYQKPRGEEAKAARVDAKQMEIWAAETEIGQGAPAARVGGTWRVVASKFERRDSALALNRRLRASGYPAQMIDEGNGVFVVQVPGLAGEAEARGLMAQLRGIPGVTIPSVSRVGG